MNPKGDNPDLLCQDCNQPLFRWFLSRIGWTRTLKEMQVTEKKLEDNSMNLEISVLVKDVYGQKKFYPRCNNAKIFAAIAGTTTLTEATLRKIMHLGYLVKVEHEVIEIQEVLK